MPQSQNVRFKGSCEEDTEYDHPRGASIARLLQKELQGSGWEAQDFENWRDQGWSILCENSGSSLIVCFSCIGEDEWMLQVAPEYTPGLFGKMFGKEATSTNETCLNLSRVIHKVLINSGFSIQGWCWDGYPEEGNSTNEPVPA